MGSSSSLACFDNGPTRMAIHERSISLVRTIWGMVYSESDGFGEEGRAIGGRPNSNWFDLGQQKEGDK